MYAHSTRHTQAYTCTCAHPYTYPNSYDFGHPLHPQLFIFFHLDNSPQPDQFKSTQLTQSHKQLHNHIQRAPKHHITGTKAQLNHTDYTNQSTTLPNSQQLIITKQLNATTTPTSYRSPIIYMRIITHPCQPLLLIWRLRIV